MSTDFEKTGAHPQPYLKGHVALSRRSCRFELPMDLKVLEHMNPMDYLTNYSQVCNRRGHLFTNAFCNVDKDRDGLITSREAQRALRDIYSESLTGEGLQELLDLAEVEKKTSGITKANFVALAAFCERFLYTHYLRDGVCEPQSRSLLEETDFSAMTYKLENCRLSQNLLNVLYLL